MSKFLSAGLLIFLLLAVSSCQTLSKDECIAADWRVIGEQDGADGHDPQQRFGKHVKACEKASVIPNQTLWNEGYQVGLYKYCTPLRGLSAGQAGSAYNNVCPPDLERQFLSGYQLGMEEYRIKNDIRNLENQIATAERRIDELEDKLSKGKGDERNMKSEIREKRQDIRRWNRDIGTLDFDLGRIQRDIDLFTRNPQPAVYR
jgi:hypothetical protein